MKGKRAEFELHGLNDVITLKHRNIYKDGFELVDQVDSVFLDLPAPWEAISHAKIALRVRLTLQLERWTRTDTIWE